MIVCERISLSYYNVTIKVLRASIHIGDAGLQRNYIYILHPNDPRPAQAKETVTSQLASLIASEPIGKWIQVWRVLPYKREFSEDPARDKFFITEILNDLHRHGFPGHKAEDMLHDWARELRERAITEFPASRLRKEFNDIVGACNW